MQAVLQTGPYDSEDMMVLEVLVVHRYECCLEPLSGTYPIGE